MEHQKTIQNEVSIEGIGLHTGNKVRVRFKPAMGNSGINFVRVDLPDKPVIKAHIGNVIDLVTRPRRTSVGKQDIEVQTIEHVMATLVALGIDNITIEIDSNEFPGMDGSASPFLEVLRKAGIREIEDPKKYFRIREALWVEEDDASIVILPADDFKISYTLSYSHPVLKAQYVSFVLSEEGFEKEIAPSRTFCLEIEAEKLRVQGLGKGANYENTLVVGEGGIVRNTLRYPDEFARHKVLDLMGDLYLLGIPIKGHVLAIKSGHPLNIKLLQKIYSHYLKQQEAGIKSPAYQVESVGRQLDINAIHRILPHRYPFLLVDRILELEEDKHAVGIKNVTINDQFFLGHFPQRPLMPGVLIVEAMAQVAGVLMLSKPDNAGKLAYFMSMDKVKFRKTVVPGDQLRLDVEVVKLRSKTGQVRTKAVVDDQLVAEAELMFSLVEV